MNYYQSPRQGGKIVEGNFVDCGSITNHVYLTCDTFVCNGSFKRLVPASENHHGWKEYKKVTLCFKCDEEKHDADYQRQDSSAEKENEEVVGTSDDC